MGGGRGLVVRWRVEMDRDEGESDVGLDRRGERHLPPAVMVQGKVCSKCQEVI